jgi:hypothetical protein
MVGSRLDPFSSRVGQPEERTAENTEVPEPRSPTVLATEPLIRRRPANAARTAKNATYIGYFTNYTSYTYTTYNFVTIRYYELNRGAADSFGRVTRGCARRKPRGYSGHWDTIHDPSERSNHEPNPPRTLVTQNPGAP